MSNQFHNGKPPAKTTQYASEKNNLLEYRPEAINYLNLQTKGRKSKTREEGTSQN